ncbi:MAG: hypothetical protein GX859_03540 [Corynebacterium humireducens]|jgi:hypothetical protein|uniref:Uncharacterized protein n=1 Tax=Corynebacterium humireducens TaxID=1223514 RepID=A0A7X6PMJ7_9CORY|nr:hypothetical protein [Corynebacterium humireducens]
MDQLTITSATADHLDSLLRRLSPPAPPTLPPGSHTAAALDRAARHWTGTHRAAESALRDHVHEVRGFLGRVRDLDRSLF